jgi:NADPH2:quinone reductase
MQAAWYERLGAAGEVLQVGETPTPSPGRGEVLVRVACSGVNPSDAKTRAGLRGGDIPYPRVIPHCDGAGIVEAVGEGVDRGRLGERVWLWNAAWGRAFGTAAQYVALPGEQAVPLPASIDFAEGACLGVPALTAYHSVCSHDGVAGANVLVTGGAGAVGFYAIQIAKLKGARLVVATVSGPEKAVLAAAAGADVVVNYRDQDVVAACVEATDAAGIDRIIDVDVSANIAADLAVLRPNGRIVAYGSNAPEVPVPFVPAIMTAATLQFFIVYKLAKKDRNEAIGDLTAWLQAGQIRHNVAERLPLERIVDAHEAIESGRLVGQIVLEID